MRPRNVRRASSSANDDSDRPKLNRIAMNTESPWRRPRPNAVRGRLRVELLEPRVAPSVAYDFSVVAQTSAGGLTAISPGASLNHSGQMAFVGNNAAGQSIYFV